MKTNKHFVRRALSLAVGGVLCGLPLASLVNAETLWVENFDAADLQGKGAVGSETGAIIDLSGVSAWNIDVSQAVLSATSDWFKVDNQQFDARDLDGPAFWVSQSIDISGKIDLTIELDVSTSGTFEATDFFDLEYAIDGGNFTKVTNYQGGGSDTHTLIDDINSVHISHSISTGSSIQIRLSINNNAGSEYTRFDNVMVNAGADDGGGGGNPGSGAGVTFSGQCFNCPDVTTIADAATFDDAEYYSDVISAISAEQPADQIHDLLNGVLQASHQQLTYSQVWTALTQTDEDPADTNNVILIYRGNSIAKMSNGSGSQSTNEDNWNREHVWAKSHGFPSSSQYAYTDIHHLRPSDISVNASRGNLDFDNSDAPLPEAPANRVDGDSFEPRDVVKGDVARMALYMDVRYDGDDGSTPDLQLLNNLTNIGEARLGKLCSLLAWHQADPIDDFEQRRNNRIYEFQGNRNPFVDHPEWVDILFNVDCSGDGGGGGTPPADGDELFFSEYVEGSGYNKALEVYNPTSQAVDLSNYYSIAVYANGSTNASSSYQLTGSLSSHDVLVVANNRSEVSDEIKAVANQFSSAINFNGDDYVELLFGSTLVDNIGTFGVRENWGKDKTIVRRPEVTVGDTDRDDAFDLDGQWLVEAKDDFSFLGSHNGDGGGGGEPVDIGQCGDDATAIYAIQGSAEQSPLLGEDHIVEGVVTHVTPQLQGYYVQQSAAQTDGDDSTSDGIFIYHNGISEMPIVGNRIRVMGQVNEYYDSTQLSVSVNALDCGEGVAISPKTISMPVANIADWESVEGMLVSVEQSLVVSNTYDLARYGQLTLSSERLAIPTNRYLPNSDQAIALASSNARNQLVLDDQDSSQNPATLPYLSEPLSYLNPIRVGDSFESLQGVIGYSFGDYRLLTTSQPIHTNANPRTLLTTPQASMLRVASMNVLNYFNGDGNGGGFPTSRGADNLEEFERQHAKIVSAISELNADVIGLMEIENDGYGQDSALAQLVAGLNANHGEDVYQFTSAGGTTLGSDQITVALIYRSDRVQPMAAAVTTSATPFDFGNRQPLAQTFEQLSNGEALTVVVNHFKSKGSCSSATGDNQDQGDGQGCWNALRVEAANGLSQWLATNPTGSSDSDVLVIGDLNAYAKEDPINALIAQGYSNLVALYNGEDAYSYSFGGQVGYLDHALASEALAEQIESAQIWHINADEPRAFDYNTESKSVEQIDSYYGDSAYRSSDHDPVVIDMLLNTTLFGDFDADGDVDIADVRAFYRQIRAGQSFSTDYDFNQDGVVNTRDVRGLMTHCTRTRCATR